MLLFWKGAIVIERQRHLGGFIRAIDNAMSQDMRQNCERLGLTTSQGMFLQHLWFRQVKLGVLTYAKDLEEFFDVKHPTVSGILQRMEAAGFVQFQSSETDRRCKAILLTDKAMEIQAETNRHIQQTEARLVQGMSEHEVQEFRRLLRLAADNLGVCHMPPIPEFQKEESDS